MAQQLEQQQAALQQYAQHQQLLQAQLQQTQLQQQQLLQHVRATQWSAQAQQWPPMPHQFAGYNPFSGYPYPYGFGR